MIPISKFPESPHIAFAIHDIEQNYMDLLTEEEKYDLAVAKQAGRDYTHDHYLRVMYLLDGCKQFRNLEKRLKVRNEDKALD